MKKIFTLIFLLITAVIIKAQWGVVEQIPLQIIYSLNVNGKDVYAGGDTLYISSDNGASWRKSLHHNNSPVTAIIKIDNILYAGFYETGIFKSTDNGFTWEEYNAGLSTWGKLPASFVRWGDTLFYATDGGGVYYTDLTTNSGWVEYNTGLPWNVAWTINSICHSANNLIVGAGSSGFYFIRPKGSPEWIEKTIDSTGRQSLTPKSLIAFGDTVFAGTRSGIFRSLDGGFTWDSVGIRAIPLDVTSLTNDGNRIYAGLTRLPDFFVWYSDDMGNTWNSLDHQFTYLNQLHASNNRLWGATSDGLWYNDLEISDINDQLELNSYKLYQNYPNPFNPLTKISYSLAEKSSISLIVYDLLGTEIANLYSGEQTSGDHSIIFNAEDLSSGIYFAVLKTGDKVDSVKMILLK